MTNKSPMGFPMGGKVSIVDLGFCNGYWPPQGAFVRNASSVAINGAAQANAVLFQPHIKGNIVEMTVPLGTVTSTGVYSLTLETIDNSTGHPTGSLIDPSATVNFSVTATTDNSTVKLVTFPAPIPVLPDTIIAAVIRFVSGTPNCGFTLVNQGFDSNASGQGKKDSYNGTTWTRAVGPIALGVRFENETKWRQATHGIQHRGGALGYNLRSSDSPDEAGNRFRLPFGIRCTGLWFYMNMGSPSTNLTQQMRMRLYSENDDVLASMDFYGSWLVVPNGGASFLRFPNQVVLNANTWYKATLTGLNAVGATSFSLNGRNFTVAPGNPTDPDRNPYPDWFGRDIHAIIRTDLGAWTKLTSVVAVLGVIYDQIIVPEVSGPAPYGTTPHQYY